MQAANDMLQALGKLTYYYNQPHLPHPFFFSTASRLTGNKNLMNELYRSQTWLDTNMSLMAT